MSKVPAELCAALRRLSSAPAVCFSILATWTMALATATAAFSLVQATQGRAVAVPYAERLVAVTAETRLEGRPAPLLQSTFEVLQTDSTTLAVLAMYAPAIVRLEGPQGTADASVEGVTPAYFSLAGVRLTRGRLLAMEDGFVDAAPVAVLHESFARRLFGSAEAALGRSCFVEGRQVVVVGLVGESAGSLDGDVRTDAYIPLRLLRAAFGDQSGEPRAPYIVGRLADNATLEAARAEVAAKARTALYGSSGPQPTSGATEQILRIESIRTGFSGLTRQYGAAFNTVAVLGGLFLAIAGLNAAGLAGVRASRRRHELTVRLALGASRRRLVLQELLDHLLLSLAALVLALPIAWWMIYALSGELALARPVPLARSLTPDARVIAWAAGVALSLAVVSAVLPALYVGRLRMDDALRGSRATIGTASTDLAWFLPVQVAIGLALFVLALLCLQSVQRLDGNTGGLRTAGMLWTRLSPDPRTATTAIDATYLQLLTSRLAALSGGEAAVLSGSFPAYFGFVGQLPLDSYGVEGLTIPRGTSALTEVVSPGFFSAFGISQRTGRDFAWQDDISAPSVAILNDALATKLFPNGNAIGGRVQTVGATTSPLLVVGVVADAPIGSLREPHQPVLFRPIAQVPARARFPLLHVHVQNTDARARGHYVTAVEGLGRHYVRGVFTLEEWTRFATLKERLAASLAAGAAVLAVMLVSLGAFVLISQSVEARSREIGLRLAIGATTTMIAATVLRRAGVVLAGGLALGVPAALFVARWVQPMLYVQPPRVGWTVAAAIVILCGCVGAAVWRPTARAIRMNPVDVLRE